MRVWGVRFGMRGLTVWYGPATLQACVAAPGIKQPEVGGAAMKFYFDKRRIRKAQDRLATQFAIVAVAAAGAVFTDTLQKLALSHLAEGAVAWVVFQAVAVVVQCIAVRPSQ